MSKNHYKNKSNNSYYYYLTAYPMSTEPAFTYSAGMLSSVTVR